MLKHKVLVLAGCLCCALGVFGGESVCAASPETAKGGQVSPATIEVLQKRARAGAADAQFRLGSLYAVGRGVPVSPKKAFEWWHRAALQGISQAQSNLGIMYAEGLGAPQDYQKARQWWLQAAQNGDSKALYGLGLLHARGLGVPRDISAAQKWWLEAAGVSNPDALFALGQLEAEGFKGKTDYVRAREWWLKAAKLGQVKAEAGLATLYANGLGGKPDLKEALIWITLAADHQAKYVAGRDAIQHILPPPVVAAARKRVSLLRDRLAQQDAASELAMIEPVTPQPNSSEKAPALSQGHHKRIPMSAAADTSHSKKSNAAAIHSVSGGGSEYAGDRTKAGVFPGSTGPVAPSRPSPPAQIEATGKVKPPVMQSANTIESSGVRQGQLATQTNKTVGSVQNAKAPVQLANKADKSTSNLRKPVRSDATPYKNPTAAGTARQPVQRDLATPNNETLVAGVAAKPAADTGQHGTKPIPPTKGAAHINAHGKGMEENVRKAEKSSLDTLQRPVTVAAETDRSNRANHVASVTPENISPAEHRPSISSNGPSQQGLRAGVKAAAETVLLSPALSSDTAASNVANSHSSTTSADTEHDMSASPVMLLKAPTTSTSTIGQPAADTGITIALAETNQTLPGHEVEGKKARATDQSASIGSVENANPAHGSSHRIDDHFGSGEGTRMRPSIGTQTTGTPNDGSRVTQIPSLARVLNSRQLGADSADQARAALSSPLANPGKALVRLVQAELSRRGYHPGPVDGVLGNHTRKALEAFEKTYHLAMSGLITKALLSRLNLASATARTPAAMATPKKLAASKPEKLTAEMVAKLQWLLKRHGFDVGPVDGVFGSHTRHAIRAYQRKNDLPVTGMITAALIASLQK